MLLTKTYTLEAFIRTINQFCLRCIKCPSQFKLVIMILKAAKFVIPNSSGTLILFEEVSWRHHGEGKR